jgi:probable F420-dependent oxidoreductase
MMAVRQVAERAETLGFRDLWVTENTLDHVFCLDPVVVLTYAAAVTTKIRLGASVVVLAIHSPLMVAHQWACLDYVSNGRAILGVGLGRDHHYRQFEVPEQGKVRRFREEMDLIKALWTEEKVTYRGAFYNLENETMAPKPVQQPHPPIWFGARDAVGLKRAVRHGDGWMGAGSSSSTDFVNQIAILKRLLDEAKREPATFVRSKRVYIAVDDNRDRAAGRLREWFGLRYKNADMAARVSIWGSRAECIDKVGELVNAGAQHLLLNPVFDEMEHLELLAREVVPHL